MDLYSGELHTMRKSWDELPLGYRIMRRTIIGLTGGVSKVLFGVFGSGDFDPTNVINAVERAKAEGKNVFTVSNHVGTVDDPVIWGALPWLWCVMNTANVRWSLASQEICHNNSITAALFGLGKNLPTVRGAGITQPSLVQMQENLLNEPWCHIFPEAMCNQTGKLMPFKWGVGKLIANTHEPPIVIPMAHRGMDIMFPRDKTKLYPRFTNLKVITGDEVDVSEEWRRYRDAITDAQRHEIYKQITTKIQTAVETLHNELYATSA
eukprot:TRINITY_DN1941_c0_g1_i1.p1 TRINITY_DN1941_c0_g1~~TRINITY_DN1941_c0_g1_i1.p1  ORF type:complete len:305 (+),score=25.35 TRINITY_DN1941_c0_g1_i1:123-917(+)